jgi:DNA-binding transcriptional LysR family regulator
MDRLDAMQVLLAVVDEGSLSAGSRKLNAPLPSVSRKVAELERHLGTRLLIRTSRNVQLTDAGRDYIDAARQIVEQIREAELRASGEYETPRGELRITATTAFGHCIALPIAYEFLREHPEITLNVLSANRTVDLTEEHVDVGIRIGHLTDSSLIAVKIGEIRVLTVASPEYLARKGCPKTPEELIGHDGIQFGNLSRAWVFPNDEVVRQTNVRIRADDATAAYKAAVEGLGITRVPNFMIGKEIESGALVEILKDHAAHPSPVHLVYIRQGLLPLKVRAFLDWMTPRLRVALKQVELECDGLRARDKETSRAQA